MDTGGARPYHVMVKPAGPLCNLGCTYCFYLEKSALYEEASAAMMTEEVLERLIAQTIESNSAPCIEFCWQGGEPTLRGLDFFRKAVSLQQQHAGSKQISNTLQTNGLLLDEAWCKFFKEQGFLIGLSLDGPPELHDHFRVDKGRKPTARRVLASLELLIKNDVEFNTLTVVQSNNAEHGLQVYRFLKEVGSRYLQFIPVVERVAEHRTPEGLALVDADHEGKARVSRWSVSPQQYGTFLCTIFDEWIRNDVGSVFVQQFDATLCCWIGASPSVCVFEEECGRSVVVEHTGDVYSCDHYVYPRYCLGNISDKHLGSLVESEQQREFGEDKHKRLTRECRQCGHLFVCQGGCPKHRFVARVGSTQKQNYLCAGYKSFFSHVEPYMQFMTEELRKGQAPANVMPWARKRVTTIRGSGEAKLGRNDPCPCGSGKKFKKCCTTG